MNSSQLARELHLFLNAMRKSEPPANLPEQKPPSLDSHSGQKKADKKNKNKESKLLKQLTEELKTCEKCPLSEKRTNVVVGQGSANARIMVVGEAPGVEEDKQGVPFVGRSGQLLRGGFEKINLSEELVYITNVVKCRPPDNRNPRVEELKTCRPYLDRQLELIDPDVLLPLGNFGLRYFLGDDKNITSARGQVYEWKDRKLVPTYHPAYILRNRTLAQSFIDDLKLAADQLK